MLIASIAHWSIEKHLYQFDLAPRAAGKCDANFSEPVMNMFKLTEDAPQCVGWMLKIDYRLFSNEHPRAFS